MFCPKCGNKVNEDAAFCGNCGAKVYESVECKTSTQPMSKTNNERQMRQMVFLCALVGFFIPISGLIICLRNRIEPKYAKIAGISALVGTVMYIVLYIKFS